MNDWYANCGENASDKCLCSSSGRSARPCPEHGTTRVSHAPDWLISGLVKSAIFPDMAPDQPMFNTGVTYQQLKAQVTAVLKRSGINLTTRELGAATYWLTERIANNISDRDTKDTLAQKFNDFVAQYVVDKASQRATGVSDRSQIYDRKWYEENFTPKPEDKPGEPGIDKEAAEKSDKSDGGAEPVDMVYVGLDGDDMGHLVEDSLMTDDPEVAARISNTIHDAHKAIRNIVKNVGGHLIFDGGDNMLIYMQNVPDVFDAIREIHKKITKHTVTIGVGHRPIEAHYALVVGKNTGKDKTVIYSEAVKAQHDTIHQEQQQIEETQKKLKYRADGDSNVAERLRQVLVSQGLDSSNKAVSEMFWRLVQQWDLSDVYAIHRFFAGADDRDLLSAVRQTYAKRLDWHLHWAEARELTPAEAHAVLHDLIKAVESIEAMGPKFKKVMDAVDNQDLKDLDEGMEQAWARAQVVISEFAKIAHEGSLRYSHYVEEVQKVAGQIVSMAIPVDQELLCAIKSIANAEGGLNKSVDIGRLNEVVNRWVERVNTMAMCLDMIIVVSGARPMEMMAADMGQAPNSFPGQTNVPKGSGQKSPYGRHDWLTIEDYNKDKVDWRKTDDQAGLALPKGAEVMVGGDAGGSPIYVP